MHKHIRAPAPHRQIRSVFYSEENHLVSVELTLPTVLDHPRVTSAIQCCRAKSVFIPSVGCSCPVSPNSSQDTVSLMRNSFWFKHVTTKPYREHLPGPCVNGHVSLVLFLHVMFKHDVLSCCRSLCFQLVFSCHTASLFFPRFVDSSKSVVTFRDNIWGQLARLYNTVTLVNVNINNECYICYSIYLSLFTLVNKNTTFLCQFMSAQVN